MVTVLAFNQEYQEPGNWRLCIVNHTSICALGIAWVAIRKNLFLSILEVSVEYSVLP